MLFITWNTAHVHYTTRRLFSAESFRVISARLSFALLFQRAHPRGRQSATSTAYCDISEGEPYPSGLQPFSQPVLLTFSISYPSQTSDLFSPFSPGRQGRGGVGM